MEIDEEKLLTIIQNESYVDSKIFSPTLKCRFMCKIFSPVFEKGAEITEQ